VPRHVKNHSEAIAAQPRSIVHGRAMLMADELAKAAAAWVPPDDSITKWLGLKAGVGLHGKERRDGSGLDFETTKGRIRIHGKVRIEPEGVDQSRVAIDVELGPAGLIGRVLWWVADRAKILDDPELSGNMTPPELVQLLGTSESEWAEVRADLPKLFSGTLTAQVSGSPETPQTSPREADPYPFDPDEPFTPFDERNLSA
jgi:hypothetical protein